MTPIAALDAFLVLLAVLIVSLPLMIPLEGMVLALVLRRPAGESMKLAARANLRSTAWLIPPGVVGFFLVSANVNAEPTFIPALAMLGPLFAFSWWMEHGAVAGQHPEMDTRTVAMATGAANLATYALMATAVLVLYPRHSTTAARIQTSEAILQASNAKTSIAEYWAANKRFPTDARELRLQRSSEEYQLGLREGGVIAVRIVKARHPDLQDRHILSRPEIQADGSLRWRCFSTDIRPALLPASCREQSL